MMGQKKIPPSQCNCTCGQPGEIIVQQSTVIWTLRGNTVSSHFVVDETQVVPGQILCKRCFIEKYGEDEYRKEYRRA